MTEQRVVGFNGMWVPREDDPRPSDTPVGELATIREYLTAYRLTLGMKCEGLTPEQLATRSVPPSTLSLLGLVRHLAKVEHSWFHRVLQGNLDAPRLYRTEEDPDRDFNGAVPDTAVVEEAFATWRQQIADADAWLDTLTNLDEVMPVRPGEESSVRDILIHMIEEYARHCGHADLIRECIDGRTGQ